MFGVGPGVGPDPQIDVTSAAVQVNNPKASKSDKQDAQSDPPAHKSPPISVQSSLAGVAFPGF